MEEIHIDFSAKLEEIHTTLTTKLKAEADNKSEIAFELEAILRKLKFAIKNHENFMEDAARYQGEAPINFWMANQIDWDLLKQLEVTIGSGQKLKNILFTGHSNKWTNKNFDEVVEKQLAAMFSTFITQYVKQGFFKVDPKSIDVGNFELFGVGRSQVTSEAAYFLSQQEKNIKDQIKTMTQSFGEKLNKQEKAIGVRKSGVVDLTGEGVVLRMTAQNPNNQFQHDIIRAIQIFTTSTFSIKNYRSTSLQRDSSGNIVYGDDNKPLRVLKDVGQIELGIGDTDLFKSITGGMSEANISPEEALNIYYWGGWKVFREEDEWETIKKHFGHLRLMFELRGSGLVDENGTLQRVADFLLENDPDSLNIFVWSTAEIIASYLNNSRKSGFGEIRFTINDLQRRTGRKK